MDWNGQDELGDDAYAVYNVLPCYELELLFIFPFVHSYLPPILSLLHTTVDPMGNPP